MLIPLRLRSLSSPESDLVGIVVSTSLSLLFLLS